MTDYTLNNASTGQLTVTLACRPDADPAKLAIDSYPGKRILELTPTPDGFDINIPEGITLTEAAQTFMEKVSEILPTHPLATEREKARQLTLFLAGDTALLVQQAKGIFTALTEYDGELQCRDAARKALERIAQWERDCGALLELHAAAL